jgi:hypothetical protein
MSTIEYLTLPMVLNRLLLTCNLSNICYDNVALELHSFKNIK